jgi:UDP-N-acetylmuramoyl-tripeptide--D-alanyl-D-alanine ligase
MNGPTVESNITLHTLWQALTGQLPPLALPPRPVPRATLDSRDVIPGALFVPQRGQRTDGHNFIGAALQNGALAIICEDHGRTAAQNFNAALIDCTTQRSFIDHRAPTGRPSAQVALPEGYTPSTPLAFVVDNATMGLQAVGGFQRIHRTRPGLHTIGITGSIGKTSTKELVAAVMRRRFHTLYSPGNLNSEQGLPLTLLGLDYAHECAVLEMGMYALGEIDTLCALGRPQIGIVTNVGPVHLERLGSIENIAQAKSELPRALPAAEDGGVAILNWDDARVRAMADITRARVFRYGLTPEADLWADEIKSGGMEGIRFRFHYRRPTRAGTTVESLHVRVPLLGRHSVHTALRAAAAGLVSGLEWDEIIPGMQNTAGQLRLVSVPGINGSTVIDDTYNASPESTIAALNLLADLEPQAGGRRIAVLGDMRELGTFADEGHAMVGLRAANVVDGLVTVGQLGRVIGGQATAAGLAAGAVAMFETDREAVAYLRETMRPNDIVLVKGSRAVGMDVVVAQIVMAPDVAVGK